jgi:hypothetical protein
VCIIVTAEWAIARIQAEARRKKDAIENSSVNSGMVEPEKVKESLDERALDENMIRESPEIDDSHPLSDDSSTHSDGEGKNSPRAQHRDQISPDREVSGYRGSSQGHLGSLCVGFEGVSFKTVMRSKEKWRLRYEEMKSIQKVQYHQLSTPAPVNICCPQMSFWKPRLLTEQVCGTNPY